MNQPSGGAPLPRPASPAPQAARPSPAKPPRKSRTGAYIRLGSVAVVIILVLIFVFQNTESKSVHFLSADFSAPLWLLLFIVLVLGALIGYGLGWMQFRGRKEERE